MNIADNVFIVLMGLTLVGVFVFAYIGMTNDANSKAYKRCLEIEISFDEIKACDQFLENNE